MTPPPQPREPGSIRVMIVEDHHVVRAGIRAILERQPDFVIADEAADAHDLVARYQACGANIALVDLRLGRHSGLDAIRALIAHDPQTRIVVLTHCSDDDHVSEAMCAGAHGYVLKSDDPAEIVSALRAVHAGRRYLSPEVSETLAGAFGSPELTLRERQVIGLLARGEKNRNIARLLGVTEETIKGHVKNILAKLGASTRTEAVTRAVRRGWIRID
ncbi:MAG: response regulator transcription factor [Acidobacteriota bacterium]|nr:response regulator transcription factor [Acidobacteriota bacterium]